MGAVTAAADRNASASAAGLTAEAGDRERAQARRVTPLRVDAQRNLEHVLRAAREVFGEVGYGAPMEDVARRARVGVGTVYRRFPSKDVLVQRIASEETERLTEQARTALGQEDDAWAALARFLRTAASSGAGRLLPPDVLRECADSLPSVAESGVEGAGAEVAGAEVAGVVGGVVSGVAAHVPAAGQTVRVPGPRPAVEASESMAPVGSVSAGSLPPLAGPVAETGADAGTDTGISAGSDAAVGAGPGAELLHVVGQLVDRAREAGQLRPQVTVADVLLVIASGAPALDDRIRQEAASARLLDILLQGLRAHPTA
ncbi:TetR/AcrR family transcriptional regulator [Streptomyces sp. NPDC059740]|uniref:TetR/AcrR family transcriptional regulator n=1 Tax=Streptomyces sp. NPDC059740 TaxID=3346926 RepID=UPI003650C8E6